MIDMIAFYGNDNGILFLVLVVGQVLPLSAFKVLGTIVVHKPCCREARHDKENLVKESSDHVGYPLTQDSAKRSLLKGREGIGDDVLGSEEQVSKPSSHGWSANFDTLSTVPETHCCTIVRKILGQKVIHLERCGHQIE